MNNDIFLCLLIIFIISIAVGMIVTLLMKPYIKYHGPNALKQSKIHYYSKNMNKCLKFNILPVQCPRKKSIYNKIMEKIKN